EELPALLLPHQQARAVKSLWKAGIDGRICDSNLYPIHDTSVSLLRPSGTQRNGNRATSTAQLGLLAIGSSPSCVITPSSVFQVRVSGRFTMQGRWRSDKDVDRAGLSVPLTAAGQGSGRPDAPPDDCSGCPQLRRSGSPVSPFRRSDALLFRRA